MLYKAQHQSWQFQLLFRGLWVSFLSFFKICVLVIFIFQVNISVIYKVIMSINLAPT